MRGVLSLSNEDSLSPSADTIVVGKVFENTKGTRVLAHSPNAIHKRRPTRRDRLFSVFRVLQARFISVLNTDGGHRLLYLPRFRQVIF